MPRVLLIDDEPELLALLETWFLHSGYEVGTARGGEKALELLQAQTFDVVVLDLKMPGLPGLELLSRLKEVHPDVEVIVLSGQGTMRDAIEALREGRAFDFLQKPLPNLGDLNRSVERALARRSEREQLQVRRALAPSGSDTLTQREVEILACLADGMDNRAIGHKLALSEKTVKNHLTRIYEKLDVKSRTQAVLLGQQLGVI